MSGTVDHRVNRFGAYDSLERSGGSRSGGPRPRCLPSSSENLRFLDDPEALGLFCL